MSYRDVVLGLLISASVACRPDSQTADGTTTSQPPPPPPNPQASFPDSAAADTVRLPNPQAPSPDSSAADTARPAGIPREALAYRGNFIRIWRFYFGYAQSPTVGFGQVHQESRWKTSAKSKFASGIAQFTPATAAQYAKILPAEVQAQCPTTMGCPTDPNWALNALSLYDFNLHKGYGWAATADDRWRLTLAAYNGGAHWLARERVKANNSTQWIDIANACIRLPQYCKENRGYPVIIMEKWRPLYRVWLGM